VRGVTRDRFVGHFAVTFHVRCLRSWSRRQKEAPTFLSRSIFDSINLCNGAIAIASSHAFADIVDPVIVELHRATPKGCRPDAGELAGRVYDALDKAGVEVWIKPPLQAHGGAYPARRSEGG
jgi:hypothetical protein